LEFVVIAGKPSHSVVQAHLHPDKPTPARQYISVTAALNRSRKGRRYTSLVRLNNLHHWNLSPSDAIALQRRLACNVVREGDPQEVQIVAAGDVAYVERAPAWAASTARAAVVVMAYPALEVIEQAVVEARVTFPYVPGLLSFRETPALARAFERITSKPDLLLVDGHGYAHPRRFGFASHVGLLAGIPTIGCAKSRLCGVAAEPGPERGATALLRHNDEPIGIVARTRPGAKPVYVSTGHLITAESAADWVLRLTTTHRLPEPARLADLLSKGHHLDQERNPC
jgi:deoxyribonuclease V